MSASNDRERLIAFAMEISVKVVGRIKRRSTLAKLDGDDIQQEILTYVIQHADGYNPERGKIEGFAIRLVRNAVAQLIRESSLQRCNPPEGVALESLSKATEGPNERSQELNKFLVNEDSDRRRQIVSRDPLKDLELSDAVEHQISSLPPDYHEVARLLGTCSQAEIERKLGWTKRRVAEAVQVIRHHFSSFEW